MTNPHERDPHDTERRAAYGMGVKMRENEADAVLQLIAAEQSRAERNIAYVGTDADGIGRELDELDPPWRESARVVRASDGSVRGVVAVECDLSVSKAWIYGPWVAGDDDDWNECAPTLLDAALAQVPAGVRDLECCGDVANVRLARLTTARGWNASVVNHAMTIEADAVTEWPRHADGVRPAASDDIEAIAPLHDAAFPNTHTPADRLTDKMTVLVASVGDGIAGYAAGRLQPDGEGYVEYVAVDSARRGEGFGRLLTKVMTAQLMDASPKHQVSLNVRGDNVEAFGLYKTLGFAIDASIVGYRS
jgi:ribosomal protein S18 acetylase RimI-like enzyme